VAYIAQEESTAKTRNEDMVKVVTSEIRRENQDIIALQVGGETVPS
jgi:hypothetical protein